MDTAGNLNAALIMPARTVGSTPFSACAKCGFVDHTSDDAVAESGRNAMGPVARKR